MAQRVAQLAADVLGELAETEVPRALLAVRRFAPAKRARRGAGQLAAALEHDPAFRVAVATGVRQALPALVESLASGVVPPAAPPVDVAALAYLTRPPGWQEQVGAAAARLAAQDADRLAGVASSEAAQLAERLSAVRAEAERREAALRADLVTARTELAEARRQIRAGGDRVRRAVEAAEARAAAAEAVAHAAAADLATARHDRDVLAARLAELEQTAAAGRREAREVRRADEARVRVLLDTVVASAQGLRRELALPPGTVRPADGLAGVLPGSDVLDPLAALVPRGLARQDPALVDQVLAVPGVHLVVDGYNVTKLGYPARSLAEQRQRLLSGLAPVVVATGAEVTVVFDGADRPPGPVAAPAVRGVRVLFSPSGVIADRVIVDLVANEPAGRPVAVVTDDREVLDAVRSRGAAGVSAAALLARLDRA